MEDTLRLFDNYIGDTLYSKINFDPLITVASNLTETISLNNFVNPSSSTSFLSYLLSNISNLPRDSILRQSLSLYIITYASIFFLYFTTAGFSYYFIFDHRLKSHPRYLPNQVSLEIRASLYSFPRLTLMTLPFLVGMVRGWSRLYNEVEEGPWGDGWRAWAYMAFTAIVFVAWTDFCIYWVHRTLHTPLLYKRLHKGHHKWIVPTPFASHASHPVDGFLHSICYHLFGYILPFNKQLYVVLFTGVSLWSVFIHDSEIISGSRLENWFNSPSAHTLHHLYFTCNYGQYLTFCDKVGGSFRAPIPSDDPLIAALAAIKMNKLKDSIGALGLEEEKEKLID